MTDENNDLASTTTPPKILDRMELNQHAIEMHCENPSYPKISYKVALALAEGDVSGPYFDVEKLRKFLTDGDDRPDLHYRDGYNTRCFIHEYPDSVDQVIEALQEMGIRRVAYLGSGSSSFAFLTVPNNEGKQQVLVLSPSKDKHSGHPMVLPAVYEKLITPSQAREEDGLRLRVSPYVHVRNNIHWNELLTLRELLKKSGAMTFDLRHENVGEYEYVDKQGKSHNVLFLLDWGLAHPTNSSHPVYSVLDSIMPSFINGKARMLALCKLNPAFNQYRAAAKHIEEVGLQGLVSEHTIRHRTEQSGGDSITMQAATEKGLYGQELGGAIERAAIKTEEDEEFQKENPDMDFPADGFSMRYKKHLAEELKNIDPSSLHPGPKGRGC